MRTSLITLRKFHRYYRQFRPFTEPEAWTLFKIAAIAEAVGWTLLIGGIILRDYVLHGNGIPVTIAGRIHGTFFMAYIFATLALAPSLGWSLLRTLVAGLCSVPPYASLIYEQLSAHHRARVSAQRLHTNVTYQLITERE
jgi:integral membrane protein